MTKSNDWYFISMESRIFPKSDKDSSTSSGVEESFHIQALRSLSVEIRHSIQRDGIGVPYVGGGESMDSDQPVGEGFSGLENRDGRWRWFRTGIQ